MSVFFRKIVFIFILIPMLAGCSAVPASGSTIWIDVPVAGINVPEDTELLIEGHASNAGGITQVEIWINGSLQFTVEEFSTFGELYSFSQTWTPPAAGEYTIQVMAVGGDSSTSGTDSVRVQVGEAAVFPDAVTPVITDTVTPTPDITDTITPTPELTGSVVEFYADPPEIVAGACTTLYWNVENAQQVIFGGVDQPFSGSDQACLCATEYYPLTVVNLDGTEERHTVEIKVTGTCAEDTPTFTPEPDTTSPPAPSPSVPGNGSSPSCRSTQTLEWLPVDDPSGISGYYVKLEMLVSANNWQPESSFGPVSGTQVTADVDCGGQYRWMVRAQDGAGNYSDWSAYSKFSIDME